MNRLNDRVPLSTLNMYCERQESLQCGVHALNAMAGRKIANGANVCAMLTNYECWPEGRTGDRASYDSYSGNYAVSALNVWLWAHAHQHVTLINFYNNLAPEMDPATMNEVLARAPPGCDRIFVW